MAASKVSEKTNGSLALDGPPFVRTSSGKLVAGLSQLWRAEYSSWIQVPFVQGGKSNVERSQSDYVLWRDIDYGPKWPSSQ
ncbi:hypothetical protein SERLA73DRAFT_188138 [Serpula lacrymans var. lacrymans S7.3]|uniref:Uncharacterized protein n=1 Tax=Serpula lacrymans var. lacrymans (strain S7.3) TaxID=936435 RepID=F8QAT7_SERL3|nr:hypothetical protein SERLA73DRAFT_188138 [Serpula lacrymans var. lacrymans S7.3]